MGKRRIFAGALIVLVGLFLFSTPNIMAQGLPCTADFTCDQDVDGEDLTAFLSQFGRGQYSDPCPDCYDSPCPCTAPQASVAKTGQTTSYGSGDDGDLEKGVPWPNPRFTDNGDGTVTDNLTGLMWTKNANLPGTETWQGALDYVAGMNSGTYENYGYTDWSLPNRSQLKSLLHIEYGNPVLPDTAGTGQFSEGDPFTNVETGTRYWSSTTNPDNTIDAFGLAPGSGGVDSSPKTTTYYVWPVRIEKIGPAPVAKTGQTTSYATGDDGDLEKGVVWPNPRFTDNCNGTVTDNLTGLIWLKDANCFGQRSLKGQPLTDSNGLADPSCGLTDGSIAGDWRLPNIVELNSLMHYGYDNPALPNTSGGGQWSESNPFTNVQTSMSYWSSSTVAYATQVAWHIRMWNGGVTASEFSGYVWPVRGPE